MSSETVIAAAPASLAHPGRRGLVGWVCTSNPFYVISAMLVLVGLWVSFGAQARTVEAWALMLGLASYTLLLAATACLLVRRLGVWDDARTILLLVVLLFLATSVTFDEVLVRRPGLGISCYVAGLVLAVAISEGLLRGIGLALPIGFRGPYYLILALFFIYPVVLVPLEGDPRSEALEWALFGFAPLAGVAFLTLVPAIRRGRDYTRQNGGPWPWPLYPWSLFALLGFGVMARAYLLCWSMQHLDYADRDLNLFGPFFLAPFLLAVGVLLLQIGLTEERAGMLWAALGAPLLMVTATLIGHRDDAIYQGFLRLVRVRLGGTPFYLALWAAAGFYAYAALRRIPAAVEMLTGVLLALACVGPDTLDLGELDRPRSWPILAAAVVQLGAGWLKRDSWRCAFGVALGMAWALLGAPAAPSPSTRGPVAFHAVLLTLMLLGALFHDTLGRWLRGLAVVLGTAAALVVLSGRLNAGGSMHAWVLALYPLVMAAVLAVYAVWLDHWLGRGAAVLITVLWLAAAGWRGYCTLRQIVAGLDYIAVGMTFFALAFWISTRKGGARLAGLADRSTVFETGD